MKLLVINPIMYTSETKQIKRAESIKDTMIYDLCLAFNEQGHDVTLFAAEPFKPTSEEEYPFPVVWGKCVLKKLCLPHRFPFMPGLISFILKYKNEIELIISSEVFSLSTLSAVLMANNKVVVWHELAKHNALFKKIPSRLWYNVVARLFMRNTCVVARSEPARIFVHQFCKNTQNFVIDHGVNLDKFQESASKQDYFVVCSQLISRKRIDGIIYAFHQFLRDYDKKTRLYIFGEGPLRTKLEELSRALNIEENVIFMGKMRHKQMVPFLASAKALLVNTEKDNSMISIVESISVGTPIVTTDIPLNAAYIKKYELGIVGDWTAKDLDRVVRDNERFVANCLEYRNLLSTKTKVQQFVHILNTED